MNYYVSIGDSYDHFWQINILINSFKKLDLQDNLHIAISSNSEIPKNYLNFKNVYFFNNEGFLKEYLKYNKWYCLYELLNKEVFTLPLTVLEPHTVIAKDTSDLKGNIVYNINDEFKFNNEYVLENQFFEVIKDNWIRLGDNYIFRNLDYSFFLKILHNMEIYCMFLNEYKNLDKFSIINAIWEYNIQDVFGLNNFESYLPQNQLNYILDYRHGFKDKFHKSFFKQDIKLSCDSIKELIGKNRYSKCLDFFYNNI